MKQEITAAKVDCVLKKWEVHPGDAVEKGTLLCTVTISSVTGRIDREVRSKYAGTLTQLSFEEGSQVAGGSAICTMEIQEEAPAAGVSYPAGEEVPVVLESVGGKKGKVRKWHKKEHDIVKAGEQLLSIEAGKLTAAVKSPCSGELVKIAVHENQEVGKDDIAAYVISDGTAVQQSGMPKEKVRVAVIGAGPGGYVAAIRAAQLGGDVTLIEKERVGGTCLNVGCIPTKALLHSAEVYRTARGAEACGVKAEQVTLDWAQVQAYRAATVNALVGGVDGLLQANGVKVIPGCASFQDEKTLTVTNGGNVQTIQADKIIIASGSKAFIPPIPGLADAKAWLDSTGALELDTLPGSLLIIGGGVIGIELACAYAEFGTQVTVVEMLPRILPAMDQELTMEAQRIMEKNGIRFALHTQVLAIENGGAGARVLAKLDSGEETVFEAEKVLVAVGRRSQIGDLNLEKAGVQTERGRIVTNDRMETNVQGIYAIGDCTGRIMLAHTASAMGETAAENAMGKKSTYDERICPSCVYMQPEFAAVGLTEEQAKEKGLNYKTGTFPMAANGKAKIMEEPEGSVKIIGDARSGKILGVHILGARATDLIAEAAAAMKLHASVQDLIHTIHPHPTVSEAVREAALAFEDRAVHYK